MEERAPPPPPPPPPPPHDHLNNNKNPHCNNCKPKLPDISPGTYVVQVPKDQIYRVPTPENARIAELHRNSPPRETRNRKGCCCLVLIIIILVFIATIVSIGGVLGGLFSVVLTPKSPSFSIQRFHLVTSTPHPQYDVVLQVYNPNSKVGISYKHGGRVSLSLRRQQVASGDYPSFYQPRHNSTAFGLALRGSKAPKGEDESDKKKVHVTFSLAINVQARIRLGLLRSGTMKYDVACQVTMDTLAKNTRVVSQQCETERH